jgi:hypothetical protein
VRYVCFELEAEVRERGDLARIRSAAAKLAAAFRRFARLREDRLARVASTIPTGV